MANGDLLTLDQDYVEFKLLDAQATTLQGPWIEVLPACTVRSFMADAIESGASIQIQVSNAVTLPGAVSGPSTVTLTPTVLAASGVEAYRWYSASKTQGGTPAASTVILRAARHA